MDNKPKTSSYKRLKPYIKGFQVPFVLAIVGAIISAVITVNEISFSIAVNY